MVRTTLWMMMAGALVACGADKSPVEQCDDLVSVVCDRGVQCLGGTHNECVQAVQQALPCGSAKAVSASYDRCIDQLQADSCGVLFPNDPQTGQPVLKLPADCMSVVLTREGAMPGARPMLDLAARKLATATP